MARELTLAAQGGRTGVLDRLCAVCARTLPVDGAAIAMMATAGRPMARSASSTGVARLEELQFTLGEGPALAAFAERETVVAADLRHPDVRWPVFASQASPRDPQDQGFRAVYAFPLVLGHVPLGVLDLYRRAPGGLDPELHTQARLAVDTVALAVVGSAAPVDDAGLPRWLDEALGDQVEVDQAVGMVMVQLGLEPEPALARMRAHAFAHGLMIGEVAQAVVDRRLRFSPEDK
ncbi:MULTISPECIES: GAF and ANTAR domain-containing protein [Streptacidiphilus]|uniref:GAF and ANTAR domain-containing protein n=1 Tax=Streptacidiphilus cavernicola TaxID=3342716 RepID=A0ABV6UKV4_9ACTN|nr:GAF and ANTAR domain-containing protein [Streptacidiphilus jeojiense]